MVRKSLVAMRVGDRNLWIDFVSKVKKQRKKVWEVLQPMIKKYLEGEI